MNNSSMKHAFPPVVNANATVLILGSMPGEASLTAQQYYAFSRNAFWGIMGELAGALPQLPYQQRLEKLQQAGIALWDVLAACEREGSLDSAIDQHSLVANDFQAFLNQYPKIERIYFNGKTVRALFARHVQKQQRIRDDIVCTTLPSTSPANARISFEEKLQQWSVIVKSDRC